MGFKYLCHHWKIIRALRHRGKSAVGPGNELLYPTMDMLGLVVWLATPCRLILETYSSRISQAFGEANLIALCVNPFHPTILQLIAQTPAIYSWQNNPRISVTSKLGRKFAVSPSPISSWLFPDSVAGHEWRE